MKVSDAIQGRRTIRAFKGDPVSAELISEVLGIAGRAPSNGNLQPWRVYVVSGGKLAEIKKAVTEKVRNEGFEEPEYAVYPRPLKEPYRRLRFEVGEALYRILGVSREDKVGRHAQFAKNAQLFGAPVGLFFYIDRSLGEGQWMDLGMYIQSVMLLFKERGLDTCAQGYWSFFPRTLAEHLAPSDELMLACGLAVGYADPDALINTLKSEREPLSAFATFID